MLKIVIHILLFNSDYEDARASVASALSQHSLPTGSSVEVWVSDNASERDLTSQLQTEFGSNLRVFRNCCNLGFCGGHNLAIAKFLEEKGDYFLVMNPDLRLTATLVNELVMAAESRADIGTATPLLLRCEGSLSNEPIIALVDSAGIEMTHALRHLDRGAGETPGKYSTACDVFGGTGACLLLKRTFIEDLLLPSTLNAGLFSIHPALAAENGVRAALFDEAFFAYREDADLAWRGQLFGWRCRFVPSAVGFHRRVVTPQRRRTLPVLLNRLGVRNRFLLQINNLFRPLPWRLVWQGLIWRNLLVFLAVMLSEQSSAAAFADLFKLWHRAIERRRLIKQRTKVNLRQLYGGFKVTGHRGLGS